MATRANEVVGKLLGDLTRPLGTRGFVKSSNGKETSSASLETGPVDEVALKLMASDIFEF